MNIISNLIKKVKFRQLLWGITFLICTILGTLMSILLLQMGRHQGLVVSTITATIFCIIGMFYFVNRLKNLKFLIRYHGNDEHNVDGKHADTEDKIIYKSPNHAPLGHIIITDRHIISIDNAIEIIPIEQIRNIKFTQSKGVINSSKAFHPTKWQNTALMTLGRGWPDTIYAFYKVEVYIDDETIRLSLSKDVGENVIETLKNVSPIAIEKITIPNFDDDLERKAGKSKFWKDVLPGLLFLLIILALLIILS